MSEAGIPLRQGDSRQVALALGISVAIHALILFLLSDLKEWVRLRAPDSPPLVARLLEVRHTPETATAGSVSAPVPRETARPPERLPVQAPVPVPPLPPARPRPSAVPVVAAPAVTALATGTKDPAPRVIPRKESAALVRSDGMNVAPAAAPALSPAPAAVPALAISAEAPDATSLAQYRNAIIAAARRHRKYPRIAVENNWEGRAEVRIAIDPDGAIASIGIRTHSGYEVLDRQALEMIRKAKPVAPMPDALRGKGFVLDLPVLFRLREERD